MIDLEAIVKRTRRDFVGDHPSDRVIVELTDWDALLSEVTRLSAALEQRDVQLAGCATAALGWNEKPAVQGDYGWSVAYNDVLLLRFRMEAAERQLAAAQQREAGLREALRETTRVADITTHGKREDARTFLSELLASGPIASEDLFREGDKAGFSSSTMYRAKRDLQVGARKRGMKGGWEWFLPEGDQTEGLPRRWSA